MKNIIFSAICCIYLVTLSACGGGGSGGGDGSVLPVPTSKVVISSYLFGSMSSSSTSVTSIDATMKIPSGVFVDYSSPAPPGLPAHTYPLRSGAIVPSGALLNSPAIISGSYNTQTGIMRFSLVNSISGNYIVTPLRGTTGNQGTEFAKLYFKLAVADSNIPFDPLGQNLAYDIKLTDLAAQTSGVSTARYQIKFSTAYQ